MTGMVTKARIDH